MPLLDKAFLIRRGVHSETYRPKALARRIQEGLLACPQSGNHNPSG